MLKLDLLDILTIIAILAWGSSMSYLLIVEDEIDETICECVGNEYRRDRKI